MLKRTKKTVAHATLGLMGLAGIINFSATVADARMGTSRPNPPPPPPPFTVSGRVIEQSGVRQTQQGWSGARVAHTRSNVDGSTLKLSDNTNVSRPGAGAFSYQLRTGQGVYHTTTMWGMTREGYTSTSNLIFGTDATVKLSIAGNSDVTTQTASNQAVDWWATYIVNEGDGDQTIAKEITIRDAGTWTFNDVSLARHSGALPTQWRRNPAVAFIADPATDNNPNYLRRSVFQLDKLVAYKKGTKGTSNEQIVLNWLDDKANARVLLEPGAVKDLVLKRVGLVDAK